MDSHDYDAEEVRDAYRVSIIAGTVAFIAIALITSGMLAGCVWSVLELAKAVRP